MVTKGSASQIPLEQRYHPDEQYDLPPAYSTTLESPATPTEAPSSAPRVIPGVPNIPFGSYSPPNSTASSDQATVTIVDTALCKSPLALAKLISEQIAIPPIPEIRIVGRQGGWSADGIDFDIRLNMMRYFLPRDGQPSLTYTKLISCGKSKARISNSTAGGEVEQWAKAFSKDKSNEKLFIINRKLVNWDKEYILGSLHGLLQSCNYRGHAEITFPVQHQQIIIKGVQSFGSTLRSVFIGSEKYEVDICWPYATHIVGEDSDGETRSPRKCLVRSEIGWFNDWKSTLKAAVIGKKKGWVGEADWIETALKGG